ncbi:alcohol dehydrogenase GroES-like domain-containing protein [Bombardia bombarda]|uniref:Alcohol dehydrogenase GroES-like domain-containing protein n=1 Tax=Bombardia bombarda TaxID=252184 RepID=A0AA39WNB5_9PEZI|nr:alcohol dehydrogenase GroES-like domain-containing protein [Bombardia bombarda]
MIQTRQALVSSLGGKLELVSHVQVPAPGPGMMLCRTVAVGLNPADAKSGDYTLSPGSIGGFDFAGEVVQVGPGVTRFKPGDRVAGLTYGYNSDDKAMGAFADTVLAAQDCTLKLTPEWTFEQGATLGVVVATAILAIGTYLNVPLPYDDDNKTSNSGMDAKKQQVDVDGDSDSDSDSDSDPEYILVSGGATATGMVAIQLLRLAGFRPVATCSPASKALVLSLGAVAAFDYHSPTCGDDIRRFTGDKLRRVLDCVTSAETMSMCYAAISSSSRGGLGGRYVALEPVSTHVKYTRRDVTADWVLMMSMFGTPVRLAGVYGRPAMPALRALAARAFGMAESLIARGALRGPVFQVRLGGLAAVEAGIEDLRRGRRGGEGKLVYPLV